LNELKSVSRTTDALSGVVKRIAMRLEILVCPRQRFAFLIEIGLARTANDRRVTPAAGFARRPAALQITPRKEIAAGEKTCSAKGGFTALTAARRPAPF
jgi:hypothetical protein